MWEYLFRCVPTVLILLFVLNISPSQPQNVRLVNGCFPWQGRVEVLHNGTWGAVCDDGWDLNDAKVVCKSLGFGDAAKDTSSSVYGRGTGDIILDGVECAGDEASIFDCPHGGLGNHSGEQHNNAGVRCQANFSLGIQLVGSSSYPEGRVEVFFGGEWGTECDDDWDLNDAQLVCRGLGFGDALDASSKCEFEEGSNISDVPCARNESNCFFPSDEFGQDCDNITFDTIIGDVWCDGSDLGIFNCSYNGTGSHNCSDCHDAGDRCADVDTTTATSTVADRTTEQTVAEQTAAYIASTPSYNKAIEKLAQANVTSENVEKVSEDLADFTAEELSFKDLENVATTLTSVVNTAILSSTLTEEHIEEITENVLEIVNNILYTPEEEFRANRSDEDVSGAILSSINAVTTAIQNSSTGNFTYSGSNIVMAAVKVARRTFPLTVRIDAGSAAEDNAFVFKSNDKSPTTTKGVTSVSIPEAILHILPGESNEAIQLSMFIVTSDKLFQTSRDSASPSTTESPEQGEEVEKTVTASPILSVTIEGANTTTLPEPVVFTFPVNESLLSQKENITDTRCVYWHTETTGGEWSPKGCITETLFHKGLVSCTCDHLTSFTVLMDIKGRVHSKVLEIVGMIGCITSIVCLVLTIGLLLSIRKLRHKQPQRILVNLSCALLGLYFTFAIGIDKTSWEVGCEIVAILLHYFCLASITWMGIEASSMYLMFVKVMNTYTPKLLLKCCLVGWGVPFGVVVITAAVNWTAYKNPDYCYLRRGQSLKYGLLLPIAIILAINLVIYVMVIYKLTCGRKMDSKRSALESKEESDARFRAEVKRRVQNAIAIGVLLGLTWVFGFMAVLEDRGIFNALFIIFNSTQGVFIFLLFGIRQPEVRELLRNALRRLVPGAFGAERKSSSIQSCSTTGPRTMAQTSNVTLTSYNSGTSVCSETCEQASETKTNLYVVMETSEM